jgi:bifunctional enzyme CysN/CysC
MEKPIIRLVTCGSVDDGKSTLIGRLLVETDSVPDDTVDAAKSVRRSGSTIKAGEIDFSLLTDGLEAEREQGITIDVAYRSMNLLNGRRLIIADAPGHEQYTRNMAVAASRADIALGSSRRHPWNQNTDPPPPDHLLTHGSHQDCRCNQQARWC